MTDMPVPQVILASKSESRREILENAGVVFDVVGSNVDERRLKDSSAYHNADPDDIASMLAAEKARAVHTTHPDAVVIGCDQVLDFDGKLFDKPADIPAARAHLMSFRGNTHRLVSAVTIIQSDVPEWTHTDVAEMTLRQVSPAFIDDYLRTDGPTVLSSVGAYRLEGRGAQLFERISGDYFTVLGLPLLPLLEELRNRGILQA